MSHEPPMIFVVDDDSSVCHATSRLLSAAGFRARTFPNAEALLDSRSLAEAACLILDINLPGISGLELAARLRRNGTAAIPVIFITAYDQPAYADAARALDALAYLPKPFTGNDLLGAIRRRLHSTPASM
jgi:FixJ family two-component response regulator